MVENKENLIMKKLYVKTVNGYELVFCNTYGK